MIFYLALFRRSSAPAVVSKPTIEIFADSSDDDDEAEVKVMQRPSSVKFRSERDIDFSITGRILETPVSSTDIDSPALVCPTVVEIKNSTEPLYSETRSTEGNAKDVQLRDDSAISVSSMASELSLAYKASDVFGDITGRELMEMEKETLLERMKGLDKEEIVEVILTVCARGRAKSADVGGFKYSKGISGRSPQSSPVPSTNKESTSPPKAIPPISIKPAGNSLNLLFPAIDSNLALSLNSEQKSIGNALDLTLNEKTFADYQTLAR